MAIFRVNKTNNYTVISNRHFREKEMSLKAKGLLSLMFSLPDDWDYSISGLVAICKENESAIKSALNELKQFGYLKVTKEMPNNQNGGRITYIYDVFENPIQEGKIQALENLQVENQSVEKQGQLNINNKSTNKLNTNKKHIYGKYQNVKLTEDEYQKLVADKLDYMIDVLSEGKAMKGYTYKSDYLAVRSWAKRQEPKTEGKLKGKPSFDIQELKQKAILNDDYDI